MKVITIKEPYVTPFAIGMKHYETRSWKTNYRGEIYIHTSKKKDDTIPALEAIMETELFPLGCIVLKGNLTDCIKMDDEFIKGIKKDPLEYISGFYKAGRYAWKIEDIEVIEPIKAKGSLGIWNYIRNNV
jgi:hypothetical protein